MNAGYGAPSVFLLSDLAIRAAVELERRTLGETLDGQVFDELAGALRRTSQPVSATTPFHFAEPGYYSPFERLFCARESRQSGGIEDIRAFIQRTSDALAQVKGSSLDGAADLQGFCLALHKALIQEMAAEGGFVVHGGQQHDPAETGVCAA